MKLTLVQALLIVGVMMLATMTTRFLPFLLFGRKNTGRLGSGHSYIGYLGDVLPYAAIGLLVVYCLKDVRFAAPGYGLPEAIAVAAVALLHFWKGNALLSIGAGTLLYMVLVQAVFV